MNTRGDFNFPIVNFPFLSSNIPPAPAYGVYVSQLIRDARLNVRTLNATGKLEELLHEMDRYKWNIIGLREMRWKMTGEIPTDGGQSVLHWGKRTNMNKEWVS